MAWFGHKPDSNVADDEEEVVYLPSMSGPDVMALLDDIDIVAEDASWRTLAESEADDDWHYLLSEGQRIVFQGSREKLYLMTRKDND